MFYLVYVADQVGLNLTLSETPKLGFSHVMAHMLWVFFIVNICIFLMFEGSKED